MSKMIQIRNVPEPLHRALKGRAARLGMTLSDYLLYEAEQAMQYPTISEFVERVKARKPAKPSGEAAWETIRRQRDAI